MKLWRPRSLRALTLLFLLAFLIVTIGTGLGVYMATHRTIVQLVDQRIDVASRSVIGSPPSASRAEILDRVADFARERDTADIGFLLRDAAGRPIGGNIRIRRRLPPGYSTLHATDGIKGLSAGRALVMPAGGGMMLTTVVETEPFDNYNAARGRIYILGFGSIVLVVLGGVAMFGLLVGRRIAAMRQTAEAIVDGDMRRRVPIDGDGGVFDRQARALNRMLDRIAELVAGIRNVSNDIAHDMRTPLAALRSQLSAVRARVSGEAAAEEVDRAIAQCDRILAMFAAVLRIADVEGGDRRAGFAPLDLAALVAETVAMMAPVLEESGHVLSLARADAIAIDGDRQLLAQALINLIENGARHTPPGSRITVAVARTGAAAAIIVTDDGPGIAIADRETALRRFGRLDHSRNSPGHGLGLALVRAIALLHRGALALEDAAPGLRVVLTVPLAE